MVCTSSSHDEDTRQLTIKPWNIFLPKCNEETRTQYTKTTVTVHLQQIICATFSLLCHTAAGVSLWLRFNTHQKSVLWLEPSPQPPHTAAQHQHPQSYMWFSSVFTIRMVGIMVNITTNNIVWLIIGTYQCVT